MTAAESLDDTGQPAVVDAYHHPMVVAALARMGSSGGWELVLSGRPLEAPLDLADAELLVSAGVLAPRDDGFAVVRKEAFLSDPEALSHAMVAQLQRALQYARGGSAGWTGEDLDLVRNLAIGSASSGDAIADGLLHSLPHAAEVLESGGGRFLDVGTGMAAISVRLCERFSGLRCVGLDVLPHVLDMAREEIKGSGFGDRIEVRNQSVSELDEIAAYDLAWVPQPFIPPEEFVPGLRRVHAALRPGGGIVVPTQAPPDVRTRWRWPSRCTPATSPAAARSRSPRRTGCCATPGSSRSATTTTAARCDDRRPSLRSGLGQHVLDAYAGPVRLRQPLEPYAGHAAAPLQHRPRDPVHAVHHPAVRPEDHGTRGVHLQRQPGVLDDGSHRRLDTGRGPVRRVDLGHGVDRHVLDRERPGQLLEPGDVPSVEEPVVPGQKCHCRAIGPLCQPSAPRGIGSRPWSGSRSPCAVSTRRTSHPSVRPCTPPSGSRGRRRRRSTRAWSTPPAGSPPGPGAARPRTGADHLVVQRPDAHLGQPTVEPGRQAAPRRAHHARVGWQVKFSDFSRLSAWLGEVTLTQGFSVERIEWALTAQHKLEVTQEVRRHAVRQAREKAQAYADALDLGPMHPIALADAGMLGEGLAPQGGSEAMAFARAGGGGGDIQFAPQDIAVAARVDARFASA